jgi:hypothetical protein
VKGKANQPNDSQSSIPYKQTSAHSILNKFEVVLFGQFFESIYISWHSNLLNQG